jgi:AraC family transcriptional regulator, regulatory protein of adaptative response / methylated-DNA-[protein]-cysteine methyltransferase
MNATSPYKKMPDQPIASAPDDTKWRAVVRKDRKADGKFYFAVKTTGVYCRPSCPARPALRRNVTFFESPEAAEEAGFRPCKRCWPKGPALEDVHRAAVEKACRAIETAESAPALQVLAKTAGMSPYHFHRIFKTLTGVTPKAYATACRTRRVRRELSKASTVTEAIYGSGFNSNGRFYASSSQTLGMTPGTFRKRGSGTTIRFALGECWLGSVLVAASEKGICAISLGDDPEELVRVFQDQFRNAELIGGDKHFERMVAQVIGFLEAPGTDFNLPLDVRGTAFQQKVWKALRSIPAGTTTSYTELARRIGVPRAAVRAVARACASNSIAIAIPCHRVVRNDGNLAGYRWGVQRKRALLKREAE